MISLVARMYDYYKLFEKDAYGQMKPSEEVQGQVKMSIFTTNQAIQDNIRYKDATYVGLTYDKAIDDTYVIKYGEEKLKVLYVNRHGRYIQVFMKNL